MNLKQKIEENTTLIVLGLLFTGFLTGVGAYQGFLAFTAPDTAKEQTVTLPPLTHSEREQIKAEIEELMTAHDERLEELRENMLEYERCATEPTYAGYGEDEKERANYAEAAKRMAQAISEENRSFSEHLAALKTLRDRK